MKYLLDSHVVDWARNEDPRLSDRVRAIIADASPGDLAISDVTLTELARHLAVGVIKTHLTATEWLQTALRGMVVLPITLEIAVHAAFLGWKHRDPCDRHIVATAAEHKLPLLSIDRKIHDLVGVRGLKVIW